MLNVFFTVDVEVWCDGWQDIDRKFAAMFTQYVYGPTPAGEYGLPYTLRLLNDHGLAGVFFVEPLFATRFGIEPLAEVVGLLNEARQDIQLHLHTEWVDESRRPLLGSATVKRQQLRDFSRDEQSILIRVGKDLLRAAGGGDAVAFRAGNFGFNRDTLSALAEHGIGYDSSYNAAYFGRDSGVLPGRMLVDAIRCDGLVEVPMTVYMDGVGMRQAALTACSYAEMEGLLWSALERRRESFVVLSHNFEMLDASRTRPDRVVVERFRKLCALLDRNRDSFRVRGFAGFEPGAIPAMPPEPLHSPLWKTAGRMFEQARRRGFA